MVKRYRGNQKDDILHQRSKYTARTRAYIDSLVYYFGEESEWFEGHILDKWRYSRAVASHNKGANSATLNPPYICPICKTPWHTYKKEWEYLPHFKGIPLEKKTCNTCKQQNKEIQCK